MHDEQTGVRPESCWNDYLTRKTSIRPCVPSHVACKVGAAEAKDRSKASDNVTRESGIGTVETTMHLPA